MFFNALFINSQYKFSKSKNTIMKHIYMQYKETADFKFQQIMPLFEQPVDTKSHQKFSVLKSVFYFTFHP
jgi:hypothetical protein